MTNQTQYEILVLRAGLLTTQDTNFFTIKYAFIRFYCFSLENDLELYLFLFILLLLEKKFVRLESHIVISWKKMLGSQLLIDPLSWRYILIALFDSASSVSKYRYP